MAGKPSVLGSTRLASTGQPRAPCVGSRVEHEAEMPWGHDPQQRSAPCCPLSGQDDRQVGQPLDARLGTALGEAPGEGKLIAKTQVDEGHVHHTSGDGHPIALTSGGGGQDQAEDVCPAEDSTEHEEEGRELQRGRGYGDEMEEEEQDSEEAHEERPGRDAGACSRNEYEQQMLTHMPYRMCCLSVRQRAGATRATPVFGTHHPCARSEGERAVPVIGIGFCYISDGSTPAL